MPISLGLHLYIVAPKCGTYVDSDIQEWSTW